MARAAAVILVALLGLAIPVLWEAVRSQREVRLSTRATRDVWRPALLLVPAIVVAWMFVRFRALWKTRRPSWRLPHSDEWVQVPPPD